MKPSILVVMLDFLVCSLLLFVIGTGGSETQFATSAPPGLHEEFSPAAIQAQQTEWNREYEQQLLRTQLQTETAEKEQLRATLAAKEANLQTVAAEKAKTQQELAAVETQLTRVAIEREQAQKEGAVAKERVAQLQAEQTGLQQQKVELEHHARQLGQTVVSQQATITTLSEEVRTSQARVETQLTDVSRGQQHLSVALLRLDEFARTLPGVLQTSVIEVRKEQEQAQQNLAALADDMKELQTALNTEERAQLIQAVTDVAKGQQNLQSQLDSLIKAGQNEQVGESLTTIQSGQEALRLQTAKLGEQIESIKARGPGPFKAVKNARLELQVRLGARDPREALTATFKSAAYPPVVTVAGHAYIIANAQTLGLTWGAAANTANDITEFKFTVQRAGDAAWSTALNLPACVLRADRHVTAIELAETVPGLSTMELAGPDAVLQIDQRKLNIFKTTAAGLSFEVETSPDLADARYVVVKRTLRGVAGWFENPAYRADTGDYMVTADGKLVGIMVSRERCFVLTAENLQDCAQSIPLANRHEFQVGVQQYFRTK